MKKIILVVCLIAAALTGWYYRYPLLRYFQKLQQVESNPLVENLKQDIQAPPPLKSLLQNPGGSLTASGVIYWTNLQRAQNGNLPPLKENPELDQAAALKLEDMFKQQYFEHVNPQGKGPGDLAKEVGYAYVSYGENLALGNFGNDQTLVQDWMNSPGHRANILNSKYQEIGVAVGQGLYQGQQTWIAVQEFGFPASSCPSVSAALKTQIDNDQTQVNQLLAQLNGLQDQINSAAPQSQADYQNYNQLVAQYNSLANTYNGDVDNLKTIVGQYNAEVSAYNQCAG